MAIGANYLKDKYPIDERKRDSIVAYLPHRMEEFGITPEDFALALASEKSEQTEARYRSALATNGMATVKCRSG